MSVENDNLYRQELIQKYRTVFEPIFRYIPWLLQKQGQKTSYLYDENDITSSSMTFSVYDGNLLSFVRDMQATGLMNRNYVYVYSRNFIRNTRGELEHIGKAELRNIEDIFGIMAKYILGGMTKGNLWTQAVENGVFLKSLLKIKELLEVYDGPLA